MTTTGTARALAMNAIGAAHELAMNTPDPTPKHDIALRPRRGSGGRGLREARRRAAVRGASLASGSPRCEWRFPPRAALAPNRTQP
jgi:hypothetical protein